MKMIAELKHIDPYDYAYYKLKYDDLNNRLDNVKKKSGLKKAISTKSLVGETRTFAEILDQEVEKVVLFYLKVQGQLAENAWFLREKELKYLQEYSATLENINKFLDSYRDIAREVLRLLEFLDWNVTRLRRLIKKHDVYFDNKMRSIYFDNNMGLNQKNSQLIQLYHQEGIKAIVSTLRRGFEDLYDARDFLLSSNEENFESSYSNAIIDPWKRNPWHREFSVPRISYKKRMASFSNLSDAVKTEINQKDPQNRINRNSRNKSTGNLFGIFNDSLGAESKSNIKRSISNLEPLIKSIDSVASKVLKSQTQSTVEFLASQGKMALEFSMRDLEKLDSDESKDDISKESEFDRIVTSTMGLLINLLTTYLYLANQYVVAPSSGVYARMLGMTPSMSGVIIGLTPAAALISSLGYSMWTNYSFKDPLLTCIICGILGNFLYASALQFNSIWMLLAGRLITGFGGSRVITRRYIADHVSIKDRLYASSQFVTAGALGLASGPLISSLIEHSNIFFELKVLNGTLTLIDYQNVTAPGWIMSILWIFALIGVVLFFKEPLISKTYTLANKFPDSTYLFKKNSAYEYQPITDFISDNNTPGKFSPNYGAITNQNIVHVETGSELFEDAATDDSKTNYKSRDQNPQILGLDKTPSNSYSRFEFIKDEEDLFEKELDASRSCIDFISVEVRIILLLYAVNKAGQELTISSIPLIMQKLFSWDNEHVGYYMAIIGGLVLPSNIFVNMRIKNIQERDMVIRLSFIALISILVMSHNSLFGSYTIFQYFLGSTILFVSLNSLESIVMALLAKVISPELAKGTFNSGLLATEAGTFGRVIGDMAITLSGISIRPSSLVNKLFMPLAIMLIVSIVILFRYYEKLSD